jgi:hypothetical protein
VSESKFNPITITLNSQSDVDALFLLCSRVRGEDTGWGESTFKIFSKLKPLVTPRIGRECNTNEAPVNGFVYFCD